MQQLVSEFPSEAVSVLLPLLRGQLPTNKRLAATAGMNVLSFAVNLGFPAVHVGEAAPVGEMTVQALAEQLERAAVCHAVPVTNDPAWAPIAIPWKRIVQTLLPLVLKWMTGDQ